MSHYKFLTSLHENGNPLLAERGQKGRFNKFLVGLLIFCGIFFVALTVLFLHQKFPKTPYADLWKFWLWQWETELFYIIPLFGLGVYGFWAGFRDIYLSLRTRIIKKENPNQRWQWDYPWNKSMARDDLFQLFTGRLLFTSIFAVTFYILTWEWILDILWEPIRLWKLIIQGVLICIVWVNIGLGLWKSFCEGWRYLKFGRQSLQYSFSPFVLGSQISLTVFNIPRISGRLFFTFRCIEEEIIRNGLNYDVNFYQVFIKRQIADSSQLVGNQLAIGLGLPDDQVYETQLSQLPSRYWELEIHANNPGPKFRCRFLLPVYARG